MGHRQRRCPYQQKSQPYVASSEPKHAACCFTSARAAGAPQKVNCDCEITCLRGMCHPCFGPCQCNLCCCECDTDPCACVRNTCDSCTCGACQPGDFYGSCTGARSLRLPRFSPSRPATDFFPAGTSVSRRRPGHADGEQAEHEPLSSFLSWKLRACTSGRTHDEAALESLPDEVKDESFKGWKDVHEYSRPFPYPQATRRAHPKLQTPGVHGYPATSLRLTHHRAALRDARREGCALR